MRVEAILNREANCRAIEYVLAQGVAAWVKDGVIPPNPELGMAARVCLPLRLRGELLGFVMVIDANGSVSEGDRMALAQAGESLIPHLAAELMDDDATLEPLVADLLGPERELRRAALARAPQGLADDFSVVSAISLSIRGSQNADDAALAGMALRRAMALPPPPGAIRRMGSLRHASAVLLLGSHGPLTLRVMDKHARAMLARAREVSLDRLDVVAGVGPSVEGLAQAFETAEAAEAAARAARLGLRGPVSSWDDLGVYAPLLRIPAHELRRDILPAELRHLLDVDRVDHLASTLRAYLDAGCSAQAAADALAIHRTTLYYRLRRVQELTGLDLSDGRVRVSLHVGLILLDIMQASRSNP